jgi:hypothetical protein
MTIKIERREYVLLIVIFMFSLLVLFEWNMQMVVHFLNLEESRLMNLLSIVLIYVPSIRLQYLCCKNLMKVCFK